MKDIAIYGAGGFGREVACVIKSINKKEPAWNMIGFFDDGKDIGSRNEYGDILGGIKELNSWDKPLSIVLAFGSPEVVKTIYTNIINNHIDFPNIISPDTAYLDINNISFGKGNIVTTRCFFSCNVSVGDFNIFNGYITIGHDVKIGSFNSLMPAVKVSGDVNIGDVNFFGVSSVILQKIKIGNNIRLGANSVLMTKPKNGELYIGNPAKKFKI